MAIKKHKTMEESLSRLGDIAVIKTGYNFNRPAASLAKDTEEVKVVLPKDISANRTIDETALSKMPLSQLKDTYFLKPGDILFVGKGCFNVALVAQEIKAVPSSSFYRIQITDDNFTSEYVYTFLKFHMDILTRNSRQSTERISSLTLTELSDVDIPFIPLAKQLQLKKIIDCQQKELEVLEKSKHSLNTLTKGVFTQTIKEHING